MNDQINSFLPSETAVVDARRLAGAVADMASLVEEYSLEIAAIAKAAYLSLETEWGAGDTENLAQVLSVIELLADKLNDAITHDAAQVRVVTQNYRLEAREKARIAKWVRDHGGESNG